MKIETSWMWQDGVHTRGANLDIQKRVLIWRDDLAAFGCIVTPAGQPLEDFMANGGGRYANPPEDVLEEIRASVQQVLASEAQ